MFGVYDWILCLYASGMICNISNCVACVAGEQCVCSQCNSGYCRVNNKLCPIFHSNCQICNSMTLCTICSTRYYINAGGLNSISSSLKFLYILILVTAYQSS